jgi:hypothetical protein
MNIRRVWVRGLLVTVAVLLAQGLTDLAYAAPSTAAIAKEASPTPQDRRQAQDLARSILARLTAAPRPSPGCDPATLDSLRGAASAALDAAAPTRDVALDAVNLARDQAPVTDACLRVALEDTAAELDGAGLTVDDASAVRGFMLYTGPVPPSKGAAALPALPAEAEGPVRRAAPPASPSAVAQRPTAPGGPSPPPPAVATSAAPTPSTSVASASASSTPPSAPSAPQASSSGIVANVSNQVQKLPVVYQPPKALLLHRPVTFKLVIEALGAGSSKGAFSGQTTTGHAEISRTVTATLSASGGVTITPRSPATQTVTDIANPTWLWDVTAETPNPATLELSIASLVTIDGAARPVPIEVYNAQIPVDLSIVDRIQLWIGQIDPIWKWLIGVVTVAGGAIGWVLNWRLKLRRGEAKPDPA